MTNEQIYEVIKQQLGEVEIKDCGWVAKGIHLIELVVGLKPNPQYNKDTPFLPEFEPDKRAIKLDGMEDYSGLVRKLTPILNYPPLNKRLVDSVNAPAVSSQPIATISNRPQESYYEEPKIQPIEQFDQEAQGQIDLARGIPESPTKQENLNEEFMREMMEMMNSINDRLSKLEYKKVGRPAKEI